MGCFMSWFYPLLKKDRPKCGAKCRDGHACQAKAVVDSFGHPLNGRCRLHGGLSTGAKTPEGIERIREGRRKYWEKRKKVSCKLK